MSEAAGQLRVAVIGAGLAGRAFAGQCARAGLRVTLEDVMPEKLRRAEAELGALGDAVTLVGTVEDAVREAVLAVDFVPDELESKLEIWSLLDRMAPPATVLCTPSEVLSVTDLASCTYRAERCVMVRGIGTEAVRVLSSRWTSDAARELAAGVMRRVGMTVRCEGDPDLPQLLKNMRMG